MIQAQQRKAWKEEDYVFETFSMCKGEKESLDGITDDTVVNTYIASEHVLTFPLGCHAP